MELEEQVWGVVGTENNTDKICKYGIFHQNLNITILISSSISVSDIETANIETESNR